MTEWYCPRCEAGALTQDAPNRFHLCKGLNGLTAPMVRKGLKAKLEVVEREDYVGGELVQTDGAGRPVQAVVTTRDEGQDCTVFAAAATAEGEM